MKYNFLLKILRFLVYVKRFFWWVGKRGRGVFSSFLLVFYRFFGFFGYRIGLFLKKIGFISGNRLIARDIIQPVFFGLLFLITIPQTKFFVQKSIFLPGQKTIAFNLVGDNSDYSFEEVAADSQSGFVNSNYAWRSGVITAEDNLATDEVVYNQDLVGTFAGGMAINKPWLMSGAVSKSGSVERKEAAKYIVAPGDTLKSVAIKFGVNVDTILWENNLTAKATLKLGQVLSIPPASGVMYTVKKGDTLGRIAGVYGAKSADIIAFNNLTSDGHDLHVGERIMIPGGTKQEIRSPVTLGSKIASNNVAPKNSKYIIQQEINGSVIAPPSSRQSPGAAGFVWPAAVHTITQYFGWTHHALDIAGPFETPTYAAKAGVVEKSQCGWNSGYGCVVIIDHGNGIKTLYGHHAKLLVSVGDHVETGQTIGLMGNTGNVRGITGIHVHFEVIVNGARVNPLGYVR